MDNHELLLRQLEGIEKQMNKRFDTVDGRFDKVEDKVDERFKEADRRLMKVERDILIGKTAGALVTTLFSVVGASFNWDHVKPWLISLMR